jgi:DNA-binding transcriptional regulator PaaX
MKPKNAFVAKVQALGKAKEPEGGMVAARVLATMCTKLTKQVEDLETQVARMNQAGLLVTRYAHTLEEVVLKLEKASLAEVEKGLREAAERVRKVRARQALGEE